MDSNFKENINVGRSRAPLLERLTDNNELKIIKASLREFTSHPENQSPIATFPASSTSSFDFSAYEPGTVIRMAYHHPSSSETQYRWKVIGNKKDQSINVYSVFYALEADVREFENKEKLRLAESLTIYGSPLSIKILPVSLAYAYLVEHDSDNTPSIDGFRMKQVDVMHIGSQKQVRKPTSELTTVSNLPVSSAV